MTFASPKRSIRRLYEGATPSGVRFRYALLAFDMVTVLFIIATSFLHSSEMIETLERPRKTLSFETPAERFNACVASTG